MEDHSILGQLLRRDKVRGFPICPKGQGDGVIKVTGGIMKGYQPGRILGEGGGCQTLQQNR